MHRSAKTITKENFPVFKKLVTDVILKATGKPALKNPAISEEISEKTGKSKNYIPEAKAREIMVEITNQTVQEDNRGRRLQSLINAALNDDVSINARVYTLDILAEYVLRNKEEQPAINNESNNLLNWRAYIEKNRHLLLQSLPDGNSAQEEQSAAEVDNISIPPSGDSMNAKELKILEPEVSCIVNFVDDQTASNANSSSTKNVHKELILAGMRGGIYAGVLAALITALIRYINGENITLVSTGYENMSFDNFLKYILAPLLLFQMVAGALLGSLCCYIAAANHNLLTRLLFVVISFIMVIVLRQSMARDAWYVPGTYPNFDERGTIIRMGGGLLGEPDFETIATGLMGTVSIFIFVHAFRKSKLMAFSPRETFELLLKVVIYGTPAWCLIYWIYALLSFRLGLIHEGDYLIAPSFFIVDFPHPERPLFAIALCVVYVFCFLTSIQYNVNAKKR